LSAVEVAVHLIPVVAVVVDRFVIFRMFQSVGLSVLLWELAVLELLIQVVQPIKRVGQLGGIQRLVITLRVEAVAV
jgi:hypothetical protein